MSQPSHAVLQRVHLVFYGHDSSLQGNDRAVLESLLDVDVTSCCFNLQQRCDPKTSSQNFGLECSHIARDCCDLLFERRDPSPQGASFCCRSCVESSCRLRVTPG